MKCAWYQGCDKEAKYAIVMSCEKVPHCIEHGAFMRDWTEKYYITCRVHDLNHFVRIETLVDSNN